MSCTDMKNKYSIQVIDLRVQVDHFNPNEIQLFEKYRDATANVRLFMLLIRHRETKVVSDEGKIRKIEFL